MSAIGLRVGPFEVTAPLHTGEDGEWYAAVRVESRADGEAMVCLVGNAPTSEARAALQRASERYRALEDERIPKHLAFYAGAGALVLQRARGVSLSVVMEERQRGRLSMRPATALDLAAEVAAALQHAHRKATVHGSLSPDRVLLAADGSVWVLGFGAMTPPAAAWRAPEVARGGMPFPETDQWSIGALLLGLVTGEPPWRGEDALVQASRGDPGVAIAEVAAQWPAMGRLLARLLSSDPADRFPNMSAVRKELLELERRLGGGSARKDLGRLLTGDSAEVEDSATEFAGDAQETEIWGERQETEIAPEGRPTEVYEERGAARDPDALHDTGEFQPSVVVPVTVLWSSGVLSARGGRVSLVMDSLDVSRAAKEAMKRPLLKVRAGSARVAVKREALRELLADALQEGAPGERTLSGQVVLDAAAVREAFGASPRAMRLSVPFESGPIFVALADEDGSSDLTLPLGSSLVLATLGRARGYEGALMDAPPPPRVTPEPVVALDVPGPPALTPLEVPEPPALPRSADTVVPLAEDERMLEVAVADEPQSLSEWEELPSHAEALDGASAAEVVALPTPPPVAPREWIAPIPVARPVPPVALPPLPPPSAMVLSLPTLPPGPAVVLGELASEVDEATAPPGDFPASEGEVRAGPALDETWEELPPPPAAQPQASVMRVAPLLVAALGVFSATWVLWRFFL